MDDEPDAASAFFLLNTILVCSFNTAPACSVFVAWLIIALQFKVVSLTEVVAFALLSRFKPRVTRELLCKRRLLSSCQSGKGRLHKAQLLHTYCTLHTALNPVVYALAVPRCEELSAVKGQ